MNNTYAYQKEFVDRAIDLLDSKGKAAVILPTGVGKSYIAADVIRHYLNCLVPWCIGQFQQKAGHIKRQCRTGRKD